MVVNTLAVDKLLAETFDLADPDATFSRILVFRCMIPVLFHIMTLARVHCVGNNIADFNNRRFAVLSELPMQLDDDSLMDM